MIERLTYLEFRASIFLPKIPYNGETLQKLLPKFPGFVPSVLHQSIEVNGLTIANNTDLKDSAWELISNDSHTHIIFLDTKVDVIINTGERYSLDNLMNYAEKSFEYFRLICEHFDVPSSRIAIAPTLKIDDISESEMKRLGEKIFKSSSYKGGALTNASFVNVFRVNEIIASNEYTINYNIKIKTQNQLKAERGTLRINNSLIAEIDINTLPIPQYRFSSETILDFYTCAPKWVDDFIRFYISNSQA